MDLIFLSQLKMDRYKSMDSSKSLQPNIVLCFAFQKCAQMYWQFYRFHHLGDQLQRIHRRCRYFLITMLLQQPRFRRRLVSVLLAYVSCQLNISKEKKLFTVPRVLVFEILFSQYNCIDDSHSQVALDCGIAFIYSINILLRFKGFLRQFPLFWFK